MPNLNIEVFDGHQIYFTDNGWFKANVKSQPEGEVKDRTLAGIKKKLSKLATPIDALYIQFGSNVGDHIQVVITDGHRLRDASTGKIIDSHGAVYEYNAEIDLALEHIHNEQVDLMERRNKLIALLKRIRP